MIGPHARIINPSVSPQHQHVVKARATIELSLVDGNSFRMTGLLNRKLSKYGNFPLSMVLVGYLGHGFFHPPAGIFFSNQLLD